MLSFESPVKTPWHSISISWKLTLVLISTMVLFIVDSLPFQLFALFACVILYAIGGRQFSIAGIARLKFVWPFVLLILIWHFLTQTPYQGLMISVRLLAVLGISNLMTMTSRLSDLIGLIHSGLKPFRYFGLNTRPVEIAVALVVRFTPVFIAKGALLSDAWRMRSSKKPKWRIVFPLSLAAIDDAEQVAAALKARGGSLSHKELTENL